MTKEDIIESLKRSQRTCEAALLSFKESGDPHNLTEWMQGRRDEVFGILNEISLNEVI